MHKPSVVFARAVAAGGARGARPGAAGGAGLWVPSALEA